MCGLVGIAGKLQFHDELTMKRMLVFDYFRGPDSTGFAALRSFNREVKGAKIASHPLDLFDMKRFNDALNANASTVFLGHNRLATKGGVNSNNAHPFVFGHIIGAHNGTLDVESWKALEEIVGDKFDVDSQAIFAAIAKVGIEEVAPKLQGAWALTWIDLKDNTINFLRNKERPFWIAFNEDRDHLFWASEWPIIHAAAEMSNHDYKFAVDADGTSFGETDVNVWYRYDIDKLKAGSKEPVDGRVKELKGKEPKPVQTYYSGGNKTDPFRRDGKYGGTTYHGTTSTTQRQTSSSTKSTSNIIELFGSKEEPLGRFMDKERFEAIAKYGCSWCQADIEYGEQGVLVVDSDDAILCPTCAGYTKDTAVKTTRIFMHEDKMTSNGD